MTKYVTFAAAILLSVGYVWTLRLQNATLRADAVVASVQLRTCIARSSNVAEDAESDAEIDNLDDLRDAAAEWLRE